MEEDAVVSAVGSSLLLDGKGGDLGAGSCGRASSDGHATRGQDLLAQGLGKWGEERSSQIAGVDGRCPFDYIPWHRERSAGRYGRASAF